MGSLDIDVLALDGGARREAAVQLRSIVPYDGDRVYAQDFYRALGVSGVGVTLSDVYRVAALVDRPTCRNLQEEWGDNGYMMFECSACGARIVDEENPEDAGEVLFEIDGGSCWAGFSYCPCCGAEEVAR